MLTFDFASHCMARYLNRRLIVGWNCYRVSVCSLPDLVQILPMRSTVNADATINRVEIVKADLKNNMLIRSCYV